MLSDSDRKNSAAGEQNASRKRQQAWLTGSCLLASSKVLGSSEASEGKTLATNQPRTPEQTRYLGVFSLDGLRDAIQLTKRLEHYKVEFFCTNFLSITPLHAGKIITH